MNVLLRSFVSGRAWFPHFAISGLLLFAGIGQPLVAQLAGTGTIQGSVTDSSGALVQGAQVKIVEVKTNLERDVVTSKEGFYSAAALPNGLYRLTVIAKGFQTFVQDNISLDALQVEGVDPVLAVGAESATVTVTEAPEPLNTTNSTLGSSMEVQTYQSLPLVMSGQPRDPTAFLYFTPGVTGGTINGGSGANQMNGGQSNLNETYIDGVAMDDVNQQSDWSVVHSTFSVDAVEQAQGQTSGISAAYQGQGLQNYVHKSGTNTYHGSAFEYFRNTALDGWGFYAPYSINPVLGRAIKPVEHNNEFGGTFGAISLISRASSSFSCLTTTSTISTGPIPGTRRSRRCSSGAATLRICPQTSPSTIRPRRSAPAQPVRDRSSWV
jgi:hypothetical protein